MEEQDLAPTVRAVTKELTEHNRVLALIRKELNPVLDLSESKFLPTLLLQLSDIAGSLRDIVNISKRDAEQDGKRKESIIAKAGEIIADRIDRWIASEQEQEAIVRTIHEAILDTIDAWLANQRLAKEGEKIGRESESETGTPLGTAGETAAGAPGPQKV